MQLYLDHHGQRRALIGGQHDHRIGPVLGRGEGGEVGGLDSCLLIAGQLHPQRGDQQFGGQRRALPKQLDQRFVQARRHVGKLSAATDGQPRCGGRFPSESPHTDGARHARHGERRARTRQLS